MIFAVGAVVGTIAYVSYRNKKKREDTYPAWSGSLTNEQGQSYPVTWRDFKVIDGAKIRCQGDEGQGQFKIKGCIKDDGAVLFTYSRSQNKQVTQIQFTGRVVGPNKIAGHWEKSLSRGVFEISCESRTLCVERALKNNSMLFDKYAVAFTSKEQHVVGVGVDDAGFYRLVGQMMSNNRKFRIDAVYPLKFTLYMYVKGQEGARDLMGRWNIIKGGNGDCRISITDHFVNSKFAQNQYQDEQVMPLARANIASKRSTSPIFSNTLKPPLQNLTPRQIENARLIQAANTVNYPSATPTPRDSQKPYFGYQTENSARNFTPRTPFD